MLFTLPLLFNLLSLGSHATAQHVFAHFMAQNTPSYTSADWMNDMTTAQSIGIDGFVLNVKVADYEIAQTAAAFSVAEPLNFKLLYSFDMTGDLTASDLVGMVAAHANSSAQFLWNGKVLVSSFSGEDRGDAFWQGVKDTLAGQGVQISLAPAFISYEGADKAAPLLNDFASIDGFFNWFSWPPDVNTTLTTDADLAFQSAIKPRGGPFIMSVSPWQFKNLDANNDWVELSDTLWNYRWLQAINDVKPDIVEIVTWNDYGESHYIGDINPSVQLFGAAAYVNGFDHSAWRIVAQYFIQMYKCSSAPPASNRAARMPRAEGRHSRIQPRQDSQPAPSAVACAATIPNETVVMWYRAHPKNAVCATGQRPRNGDFPADAVFALALLNEPATISLDIGSMHAEFAAGPGATIGSVPFPPEDAMIPFIQIIRNNVTTQKGFGSMFVNQTCETYNFNPWVGHI